jgi:hypothetical protein
MSTDTNPIIQRYQAAQEWLSTPGHKIRLVGKARKPNTCSTCRQRIPPVQTLLTQGR